MTTKPEGPAPEPQETSDPSWTKWDLAKVAFPHARESVVPATPAPSPPAGAREWFMARRKMDAYISFDDMEEYAQFSAQQTAAKDAEAETFRCQLRDALKLHPNVTWFGAGLLTAASAVVAERDSLREANARLAADLDAALKAGKDGTDVTRVR